MKTHERYAVVGMMLNREKDHYKVSALDLAVKMGIGLDYAKRILKVCRHKFKYAVWSEEFNTLFNPSFYPDGFFEGAKPITKEKEGLNKTP